MSSSLDEFEPDWDPDPVGFNAEGEELEAARVAEEYLGSAAVAAEPGPAWVASEPGPAAVAPEAGLDQWLPANLPIGTANFFQPHDTEQQRIDNAIQQHYARMAACAASGEYPPGEFRQDELRMDPFALAVSWHRFAESHPMYLPIRALDVFEHFDDLEDVSWMTR